MVTPAPKRETPGAVGSFGDHMKNVRGLRRISTPFGMTRAKDEPDGVDLPKWFRYAGLLGFEIDTGFGLVKCQMPGDKERRRLERLDDAIEEALAAAGDGEEKDKAPVKAARAAQAEAVPLLLVRLMREIPVDWPNEGDDVVVAGRTIKNGDMIPQPREIAACTIEEARLYLAMLPTTLPAQVQGGFNIKSNSIPLEADGVRSPS